jgi:glycosyltransferase involved in cell wall biosynthesis/SAM-dependent methyltransferase
MRAQPLVSVITIFHNEERFLAEAIESVLAQTYPAWELLLCDDGSTDGSTAIARRCAAQHPDRIRYLQHPDRANRGMSATRNLGLAHARGEMIAFLDGDDVWVPEKLDRQVDLLLQHPTAAAVYGRLHVWHGWTRQEADLARDYVQPLGGPADTLVQPPDLLIRFLRNDVFTPSGLLFRRDVLREVGGYEESFRGMHEDGIVLAKICLRWPLYASGEVWYKYRQHPDSCCTQEIAAGRDRDALRNYLAWLSGYLAGNGHALTEVADVVAELLEEEDQRERGGLRARMSSSLRTVLRRGRMATERVLPTRVRGWVGLLTHGAHHVPPAGWAHMGSLRRTTPLSQHFGFDRGQPVDRYYIEQFLAKHQADIRGRVLEIADPAYTQRFGGDRVERSDVLHARPGNPDATMVGDLCTGEGIPDSVFDCIIMTQVLPFVWDVPAAIETARRALRPGGVLLTTAPGISQVSRYDADRWGDFWRFTSQSMRRLFEMSFPREHVQLEAYGNALTATAFLHGIAVHELRHDELEDRHPDYEVTIAVRAVRPADANLPGPPAAPAPPATRATPAPPETPSEPG